MEVPEPPVMLVDESEHERFVELVETASATVPLKPLRGATVIVEFRKSAAFEITVVGLAVSVKSGAFVIR
jgi:hypothetical protein